MNKAQERFYRLFRLTIGATIHQSIKLIWEGEENIPLKGGAVVICNHRSDLDPIVLSLIINRPVNWFAGKYLFNMKLLGEFLKGIGAIPISPKRRVVEEAFAKGVEYLKDGQLLGIFPEGWDKIDSQQKLTLGNFHTGFVRLAIMGNVPVVPISLKSIEEIEANNLVNTDDRYKFGFPDELKGQDKRIVYKKAKIKIGKPMQIKIKLDDFDEDKNHKRLTAQAIRFKKILEGMLKI